MAKKANKKATSPVSRSGDNLVIDVQSLMVPLSILFAGVMIAIGLFFGLRGTNDGTTTTTTATNGTDTAATDTETGDGVVSEVSIDDDPYLGDKDKATVAIIEFTDYECPFCKQHIDNTYADIIENYVDTGDVLYVTRDYPLSFHDPLATNEALAAQCAFDQGGNDMYYEYHDLLFANTTSNGNGLTEKQLRDFAEDVGADMDDFDSCYDNREFADEIANDIAQGTAAGISGTPGFIIGTLEGDTVVDGTILAGAYPYADFQTVLDGLLGQ